jgi:hypothetical protein
MAFDIKDLSVMAYANGFTLWHYRTGDGVGDLDTSGYFNEAGDLLREGDLVISNYDDAGATKTAFLTVQTSGSGVTVDAWDAHPIVSGNAD